MNDNFKDLDPEETSEWLAALDAVLEREGTERAHFLLDNMLSRAYDRGADPSFSMTTPYINTIPPDLEERSPGDAGLEWRIRSLVRWNAMAMVVRANKRPASPGGHIASFASGATLYDVGLNHFWRAPQDNHPGDFVYFQGHSAPGIYARAFLEGRLSEDQLDRFRDEAEGGGLSSYPHPWLMPDFWQFPTVSMGLGAIMGIYQARFLKYMEHRGLIPRSDAKVWVFLGDGEMDEPESRGALTLASRENLDNLIFVINCNLQRLDGPVRGNGKIIQELEANFRGAGWNVIKVLWGSYWDPLLARDTQGVLRKRMEECLDGEYQNFKVKGGAFTREHFFGRYPELRKMVATMSDEDIWRLNRGGHDPHKVYAAYAAAVRHRGEPTVILAKTVKGYGMGAAGESANITHQQKKMDDEALRAFRDRFRIPVPDEAIPEVPFYRPPEDSPEIRYLKARREALGGPMPHRRGDVERPLAIPPLSTFSQLLTDTGERHLSTTMALVRIIAILGRDKKLGPRLVPIVPDEARTFGMEGLFRPLGIYAHEGQKYIPMDAEQLTPYREDQKGQILQEGITEAGSMSSWIAAATAYSNLGIQMIPIYLFYSMFGFQRVGDLAWASGDSRARGFLIGATAGRTTLNGEGLQHQDGHSQIMANCIPNCVSYDPTFHYEVAVIFRHGLERMYTQQEDVFYYITVGNESYSHPAMPEGVEDGILRGMYKLRPSPLTEATHAGRQVNLLGSGAILREALAAAEMLEADYRVAATVFSVTSFNELSREGQAVRRWNMLHPDQPQRTPFVEQVLEDCPGPVVATTDYLKVFSGQIRPFMQRTYYVLGTDGFGRSDSRETLRHHFEIDRFYVVVAALNALMDDGLVEASVVRGAIERYGIDPEKPNPRFA